MATDSSRGTLPSSSRFTIDSSSSIARSKLSFLTSIWVFSAMLLSRMRPVAGADLSVFMRAYCGGGLRAPQCRGMRRGRLFSAPPILTTPQNPDKLPPGACLGHRHHLSGGPTEDFPPLIVRG